MNIRGRLQMIVNEETDSIDLHLCGSKKIRNNMSGIPPAIKLLLDFWVEQKLRTSFKSAHREKDR
jgi:hypothetical protein